jgi:hypothetical protein
MGGEVLPRPGSKDAQISREKPTVSKGFKGLAQIMGKARQLNLNNLKNRLKQVKPEEMER